MTRALPLLLLLAGCDRTADGADTPPSLPAGAARSAAQPAAVASAADQIEQRARAALTPIVLDPDSMRFASLRAGTASAICGEVEAKQADGKRSVRPFVVTPEGVAVVSPTADVRLEDPEDPFPDFHMRWCATPAELARMQSRMIGGDTLGLGATQPPADIPDVPPDLAPDFTPPAPEPARPAARAEAGPPPRPPAPASDDSFFNAVARPASKDGQ